MHLGELKVLYFDKKKKSPELVPKGLIDNNQALVFDNGLAPYRRRPLSEPMLTWFTDACMRH